MGMCHNTDEMFSYGLLCELLSGRISKLVLGPDMATRTADITGKMSVDALISEK